MDQISILVENQRAFFNTKRTYNLTYRKNQLTMLQTILHQFEPEIMQALKDDLNKSSFEAYASEIGMIDKEINFMLKNMDRFAKPQRVKTPLTQFPSKSTIYTEPYGLVLIISPWNYPLQLSLLPLIGAIATGNCAIIKPSNYSSHTSKIIVKLLSKAFEKNYVAVVEGDRIVNQSLLENKFDYIFFTGSLAVGKIVLEKAAKHLTPVVLELGGKSPCIVDKTAHIERAAKRIVWGKLLNAGQTCVAPDYILAENCIKEQLIEYLKKYIHQFFGKTPHTNEEYPKIISQKHFERLCGLIEQKQNIWGGEYNAQTQQISPAIINDVHWDSKIMEDEIFGPILPIIGFDNIDDVVNKICSKPKPLALYLFTRSLKTENFVIKNVSYGGGCINDTIVHIVTSYLGLGGVGNSGIGRYHGKMSFDTLSHSKGILKKSNYIDIPIRYAPYAGKLALLKKLFKW